MFGNRSIVIDLRSWQCSLCFSRNW